MSASICPYNCNSQPCSHNYTPQKPLPPSEPPKGTTPGRKPWGWVCPTCYTWCGSGIESCEGDYDDIPKHPVVLQRDGWVDHLATYIEIIKELRATVSRLTAEKQALIDGKVWNVHHIESSRYCEVNGWRYATKIEDGPSPLYASGDEALSAYLTPSDTGDSKNG